MLLEPITRQYSSYRHGYSITQWSSRTKEGDYICITHKNSVLFVELYEAAGWPYSFESWRVLHTKNLKSKTLPITDAEMRHHLMSAGLIEVSQWKYILQRIFLPISIWFERYTNDYDNHGVSD